MVATEFDLGEDAERELLSSHNGSQKVVYLLGKVVSAVAGIAVASERSIDRLLDDFDLRMPLNPSPLFAGFTFEASINKESFLDSLREQGFPIPDYLVKNITGNLVKGTILDRRVRILELADDYNVHRSLPLHYDRDNDGELHGCVEDVSTLEDLAKTNHSAMDESLHGIRLLLSDILLHWDFSKFEEGELIRNYLQEAISQPLPDSPLKNYVKFRSNYNFPSAQRAFSVSDNSGIVHNVFSNEEWRKSALLYSGALLHESLVRMERLEQAFTSQVLAPVVALLSKYQELVTEKYGIRVA